MCYCFYGAVRIAVLMIQSQKMLRNNRFLQIKQNASFYLSFDINLMIHVCDITSKSREKICKSDLAFHYSKQAITDQIILVTDTLYNGSHLSFFCTNYDIQTYISEESFISNISTGFHQSILTIGQVIGSSSKNYRRL